MRHLIARITATLAACAVVALAHPSTAQDQPREKDLMSLKVTAQGPFDAMIIPTDPPVAAARMDLTGTSALLGGAVRILDMHRAHFGIDGVFKRSTDGIAVLTGPSGDALFAYWTSRARPSTTAGVFDIDADFTIRGGKGKYAAATGSGTAKFVADFNKGTITQDWDGTIALPKAP